MKFRPCIDLHQGKVVQIVGGSLQENDQSSLQINFSSERSAAEYAELYQKDDLTGGHVVSLGAGNQMATLDALRAFPGGLQYGGGVNPDNAADYLDAGASHVIVTSYVFDSGKIDLDKMGQLLDITGKDRLVLDLSCRQRDGDYYVVTDRWQTFTDEKVGPDLLEKLSVYCSEFLVHGVDVEGKQQGIEEDLISLLGAYSPLSVTYAGGVKKLSDLDLVQSLGQDRVDLTIGSALDIFGGKVAYTDVLKWLENNQG
ncbi:MAG: phosphoribosylformimino-5-aminoimidazole carboxamide ribotide isomerase [SAR86 cluster bacterium]|uniref:Phosphoribosylformimino-5-aminoimidazole carboxamide ribotide isomerase n=1 Tax=SAR86 cluster bacterium TaxID=2030880 RepID=A0A2A5CGI3_9GAMM|nr:MAG: phosphoribosylformimino-5-aminoimidazole carboxamide ribotide isomerase [SAR86 cluster bacterium]